MAVPSYGASGRSKASLPGGVVVEEVGKDSPGERAGIKPGDVLFSWARLPNPPANPKEARGKIESPFDLTDVEVEQAPRGEVKLLGARSGEAFSVSVPPGEWKIQARPQMPAKTLAIYHNGKKLIEAKDEPDKGLALWRQSATRVREERKSSAARWLYLRIGDALADLKRWDEAHAAYRAAIEEVRSTSDVSFLGQIWRAQGKAFLAQNDFSEAESAYRSGLEILQRQTSHGLFVAWSLNKIGKVAFSRGDLAASEDFHRKALAIREKLAPGSLAVADSLNGLGNVAYRRGDLAAAEEFHRKALAIREKLAQGSLAVAASLNGLGNVAWSHGDLSAAEDFHRKALAIREKVAPESLEAAASLNNLGNVADDRGDLAAAEDFHRKALAIREKLAPGSLDVAYSLNNLGEVADSRGDLAAAEDFLRKALAITEMLAPGSLDVAASLGNLGIVADRRDDLAAAEDIQRKALAIREKLAPGSLDVAASLANLGIVAYRRGNLAAAEDFYRKALAIHEKLAPGSLDVAASLNNLGYVAYSRGNLAAAEDSYGKALAIREKLAPGGLDVAESLNNLGDIANRRADLSAAEALYRKALAIYERLSPGSTLEAASFHDLGTISRKMGRRADAADFFRRAIAALESQKGKLGGSEEVKAGFAAKYNDYYRDYIEILLELDQIGEAFHILERSRARSLLSMLAERDLVFSGDIPAELERERKLTDADYDRAQASIAKLNPQKDREKINQILAHLREFREKQADIAESIRKASPRLASLQYPQAFDLESVRKSLDPGTALLSYSVGKEKTFLFVVLPVGGGKGSGLSVFTLPIGEESLRQRVEAFRNLLQRKTEGARATSAQLASEGASLYTDLVKPAEKLIAAADRVLICPDGPLHTLPFGALVKGTQRGRPSYFVEWKPLHTVVSATVYAEIKKSPREGSAASPGVELAAFGDPKYPAVSREKAEEMGSPEVRSAVRRGYGFEPLPNTRQEVEKIASLYAPGAVKYLGDRATEERAKSLGKEVRYIHFACHGLLDERFPLDSSLALTIPEKLVEGQDNGLLQAWEIFEKVRIDADLVTLSACETGLGKEMGGEGLVGLTRAFQYAGARSVLASLWSVADESTAELMKRFYGYLKSGKSKDEAIRQAQLDLIKDPSARYSHPFHWAAFELIGDWK
jgi:CHAT domain-containing protein/Tfp pilus assembly protein PilF